ncbi:MAG: cytochrome c oxidase subunit 3 [Anaerolineae bacterium]|nr:cytochrome c oxidase subunit 3 [Thermoflexales bacterium]MDW8407863.1 cytochrome c oxidase subunit 3 [Anaerolineae bacterium]
MSAWTKVGAARSADASPARRPNVGLIGAVFFIVSESMFFLGLFLAYFYLRALSKTWPPPDTPPLSTVLPTLNTGVLLISTLFMAWAERGIARGDARRLQIGTGVAAVLGLIFLTIQAFEIADLGFAPHSSAYGSAFFFLMGFHVVRVFGGVVFMVIILARALIGQFSARRRAAVQACALYWYFLAGVWLVVFWVLYWLK